MNEGMSRYVHMYVYRGSRARAFGDETESKAHSLIHEIKGRVRSASSPIFTSLTRHTIYR